MKKVYLICLISVPIILFSQNINSDQNVIITAAPSLIYFPDARGAGIGHTGVATLADPNSMHWNPAKYSFIMEDQTEKIIDYPKDLGFAFSCNPTYYNNLVGPLPHIYLSSYKVINKQTIAATFNYFSFGDVQFTDINGELIGEYKPKEYSLDFAYARKLIPSLSGAIALRFIRSTFTQGQFVQGLATKPGKAFAVDIALYYRKKFESNSLDNSFLNLGFNISNIGNKVSYSDDDLCKEFLPTNLRLGGGYYFEKSIHGFLVSFEMNKLLVPTPPVYEIDPNTGEKIIMAGMDDDVSVPKGMIQSFYDAPNGFKEEVQEINFGFGIEYWIYKMGAIRSGYFYEHRSKGIRKSYNIGYGFRYKFFEINLTYSKGIRSDFNNIYLSLLFNIKTKSESEELN